jgi:hypothetical protein
MNKTLNEAFSLIESMATHHVQWSNERAVAPQKPGIYQVNHQDVLADQVEILNKYVAQLQASISSISASTQSIPRISTLRCQICGIQGHADGDCSYLSTANSSVQNISEVNYAQG